MINKGLCKQKNRRSSTFVAWGHTTRVIFTVKICIFEWSNEKSRFSETKIYFRKKTSPQLLEHIRLQNMKVGEKTNFGRLATIFQICSMDADILSWDDFNMVLYLFLYNCLFLQHYDSAGFAGSTAMHFFMNWRKELINKNSATSEAFSNL